MNTIKHKNTFTLVLFVVYIVLLIWIILFKLHFSFAEMDRVRVINLIPFQGLTVGANEFYNIFFFIPLGLYICMLKNRWGFIKKVIMILCFSLSFEILQYAFAIGRSDITDLLCNAMGGIIGIGIYAIMQKLLKDKTKKMMNIILSVLTLIVLSFFILLITHLIPLRFNL